MNPKRKSMRWFLINQASQHKISLSLGCTTILRERYVYHSGHCIIDIFENKIIKIHEKKPHETYLNGNLLRCSANLTAGDIIFLGDKNVIPPECWDARTFVLFEIFPLMEPFKYSQTTNVLQKHGYGQQASGQHNQTSTQPDLSEIFEIDDSEDEVIYVPLEPMPEWENASVFCTPESSPQHLSITSSPIPCRGADSLEETSKRRRSIKRKIRENMVKSSKWCLQRINCQGNDPIIYLNKGETTIGRNKAADVISMSNICSRNHCAITLTDDEQIIIKNNSSNGTFVNEERIDAPYKLSANDKIGLGCSPTIFGLTPQNEWSGYSVFELLNRPIETDKIISLCDSDDEIDVKPNIGNGDADADAHAVPSTSRLVEFIEPDQNVFNEYEPRIIADDDEQDEDELYSQQIFREIKQEVNCTDDQDIDHDEDYSIVILSDNDSENDEDSSWSERLSQNQDYLIKKEKVAESAQNNKRKLTKQIEAMPLLPAKKARRNSLPAQSHQKSIPKPKVVDDIHVHNNKPSTSKEMAPTAPAAFVDQLDPFVVKQKTSSTFEEALKQASKPKKKRVAHTRKQHPSSNVPTDFRSIIRKNNSWPSEGKRNRNGLRVKFATELNRVREYTPDREEIEAVVIPSPVKATNPVHGGLNSFEYDPLHNIISDITEWKPEWLHQQNATPPINGVNFIIRPMTYKYDSLDEYIQVVTPLLKHELWSSIQSDHLHRNAFDVRLNETSPVNRSGRKRFIFHVEVVSESASPRATIGDFVLVQSSGGVFFAYVTEMSFTRSGYSKTTYLKVEASDTVVKLKTNESKLRITPISNIRTELKLFNAVFNVDRSPMKDLVLNPAAYKEPVFPNKTPDFRYAGYDQLNNEQLEVLKSIYNKCLHNDPSVSLIEGPPGTGKTRLIVSIILQLLFGKEMKKKLRILVLTSSNAAVDIITARLLHIREKLQKAGKEKFLNLVRFGILNSMHPDVQKVAPENLIKSSPISPSNHCDKTRSLLEEQKTLQKDIDHFRKSGQNTVNQDKIKERQQQLAQINETLARLNHQQGSDLKVSHNEIAEVMKDARVVCSTLSSSINLKKYIKKFDVCFIDEASQCTEPWSLVPLQYQISSLILVGDSNQLSPVVLSTVCRNNVMERSLFTRLFDTISRNGPAAKGTYAITKQYRMHPEICSFPNSYFYQDRLKSSSETKVAFPLNPYIIYSLECLQSNTDMVQFFNIPEAEFIVQMLKVMIRHAPPKEYSYGIITPYAKQRMKIQDLLAKSQSLDSFKIPVNTIDSYQGQEKDIIILCTTRTNGIGFLANPQRLNVALTRARKSLVICGNFQSISKAPVWGRLLSDADQRNKVISVPLEISVENRFKLIAATLVNKKLKSIGSNIATTSKNSNGSKSPGTSVRRI